VSGALGQPCRCGSGRKYKVCCYTRDRQREVRLEAARAAEEKLDAALSVVLPIVAEEGLAVACRAGCNACCASFIRTTPAEATRIATWLVDPAHAAVRARFEERFPVWRAALGPEVAAAEAVLARHAKTGRPATGTPDAERFAAAVLAHHRRELMCPFNDEAGCCSIYPVRPVPCRVNNVVGSAEYCHPDRGRGPSVVTHPQLREAVSTAARLLRGAVIAPERILPLAVAARLDEDAV
jgi:hypothetical protein